MYSGRKNDDYFYLSGLISLTLFGLVLLLAVYFVVYKGKTKVYGLKKENYIAVSIALTPQKKSSNNAKPKPKATPTKAVEPVKAEKTPEISDLFKSVSSQQINTKPKKAVKESDTKRLAAIEKRIKTADKSQKQDAKKKIEALDLVKPSAEISGASSSSAEEVNEYYAKIQALIYDNFFPPASTEGSVAIVKIWIDANGKLLDFRVLTPSGNLLFNEEVGLMSERLKAVKFPKSPNGSKEALSINLTVQE